MDIFVFGTLKSETLRTIVLGRGLAPIDVCTASIKGFCVYWAKEGPFPVMVPQESSEAHGLVLKNLSDVDVERLNYYELGFDYVLSPTSVETNVLDEAVIVTDPDTPLAVKVVVDVLVSRNGPLVNSTSVNVQDV